DAGLAAQRLLGGLRVVALHVPAVADAVVRAVGVGARGVEALPAEGTHRLAGEVALRRGGEGRPEGPGGKGEDQNGWAMCHGLLLADWPQARGVRPHSTY